MKCEDVQLILWSGMRSSEAEVHLQQCAVCQEEAEDIRQIVSKLSAIDVPAPSKRLTPSKQVIRHTVKKNRIYRTLRSSSVAAGLTVLLATGATMGWQQMQGAGDQEAEQLAPSVLSQDSMHAESIDQQAVLSNSSKQNQVVGAVEVVVASDAPMQNILSSVQSYLKNVVSVQEVQKITIMSFTPYTPFSQQDEETQHVIYGQLELDVELQPGAVTSFRQGVQKVQAELVGTSQAASVQFLGIECAAKTPGELVSLWVLAQQQRSGVLELALYTPEQQEVRRQGYIDSNWMTGSSNSQVVGTKRISQKELGEGQVLAEVELSTEVSSGSAATPPVEMTMVRNSNGIWQLQNVTHGSKNAFPTQSVSLADGRTLTTDSSLPTQWEGASVRLETNAVQNGTLDQMLQSVYGNNAQALEQETVQTPLGQATLALMQTEQPAASGSLQTTQEYWLTVFRQDSFNPDRHYALTIIFGLTDDADATYRKESLLKVATTWHVIE